MRRSSDRFVDHRPKEERGDNGSVIEEGSVPRDLATELARVSRPDRGDNDTSKWTAQYERCNDWCR
jgi:hypothetical protein